MGAPHSLFLAAVAAGAPASVLSGANDQPLWRGLAPVLGLGLGRRLNS